MLRQKIQIRFIQIYLKKIPACNMQCHQRIQVRSDWSVVWSLQDCSVMWKYHRRFHHHIQKQPPPQGHWPLRTDQDCSDFLILYLPDHLWKKRNWWKQVSHRVPRGEQSILRYCLMIPVPRHVSWELGRKLASECIQGWMKIEVLQDGPEDGPVQHEHPLCDVVS